MIVRISSEHAIITANSSRHVKLFNLFSANHNRTVSMQLVIVGTNGTGRWTVMYTNIFFQELIPRPAVYTAAYQTSDSGNVEEVEGDVDGGDDAESDVVPRLQLRRGFAALGDEDGDDRVPDANDTQYNHRRQNVLVLYETASDEIVYILVDSLCVLRVTLFVR